MVFQLEIWLTRHIDIRFELSERAKKASRQTFEFMCFLADLILFWGKRWLAFLAAGAKLRFFAHKLLKSF